MIALHPGHGSLVGGEALSLFQSRRFKAYYGCVRIPRNSPSLSAVPSCKLDADPRVVLLEVHQQRCREVMRAATLREANNGPVYECRIKANLHPWEACKHRDGIREPQRRTEKSCSLLWPRSSEAIVDKDLVQSCVWLHALPCHPLQGVQRADRIAFGETSEDEIRVDMDVGPEVVLLGELVHDREGAVQIPGATQHSNQEREGIIAWFDALALHLLDKPEALVHEITLHAAIEQRVVHDLVWGQGILLLHPPDEVKASLHVAQPAISLEHRAVRNEIRPDTRLRHILFDLRHLVHAATTRASVEDRVEGNDRDLDLPLEHLLVDGPDALQLLIPRESLQDRAIWHRVQRLTALVVIAHLMDDLIGALSVTVVHDGLDHTASSDTCRLDVTA